MPKRKIQKPTPPEHVVVVDTNILWYEDKSNVVNPEFDAFWAKESDQFPMKLIIPDVVVGELLFQQTTSAQNALIKANSELERISLVTGKNYSHRVTDERIRDEVQKRMNAWIAGKGAEVWPTPIAEIDWENVIKNAIWRIIPFTPDPKNPKNEKGFRDAMILETVASVAAYYSSDANIAFVCGDYALRKASESRIGDIGSFSTYESLTDFDSFIGLTKENLTQRFVKSILARAREKFHNEKKIACLIYGDGFIHRLRKEFKDKIEKRKTSVLSRPISETWEPVGSERRWVMRPQFMRVEGKNIYHWRSRITFVQLYQKAMTAFAQLGALPGTSERRLVVLGIDVDWKAIVRADGRFFETEITGYNEASYSFESPTEEQIERYGVEQATPSGGEKTSL